MRVIILLLSLVLLVGSASASPDIANLVLQSTARLIFRAKEGMGICSGVFVAVDTVLTAAHCLQSGEVDVLDSRGVSIRGQVAKVDKSVDLGLVRVVGAQARVAALLCCAVIGTEVVASGFPWGVRMVSFGRVEAVETLVFKDEAVGYRATEYLLANYTSGSGLSGGGVYNLNGEVVGMHVRTYYDDGPNRSIVKVWAAAVSAREIIRFVGGQQ